MDTFQNEMETEEKQETFRLSFPRWIFFSFAFSFLFHYHHLDVMCVYTLMYKFLLSKSYTREPMKDIETPTIGPGTSILWRMLADNPSLELYTAKEKAIFRNERKVHHHHSCACFKW